MVKKYIHKFVKAFIEILFLRIYPEEIKELGIISRCLLYIAAIILFYLPIFYSIIFFCMQNQEYSLYFIYIAALHIVSRFILAHSKRIQQRFSTIRSKKKFFVRVLLILEYIVLMWLVFLFYPITCILLPSGMILLFVERLFGHQLIYNTFINHTELSMLYGSIAAYVLFIFFDGYRKLRAGFLPDYLGLYAILTASSGFFSKLTQWSVLEDSHINGISFSTIFSQIFSLSNYALNVVSTLVMFAFAIYSLSTTCGLGDEKTEDGNN